jgi:cytochrome c oxidase subunit 2
MVITITPNKTGSFAVVCNEYCGIGHHQMVSRMYVK